MANSGRANQFLTFTEEQNAPKENNVASREDSRARLLEGIYNRPPLVTSWNYTWGDSSKQTSGAPQKPDVVEALAEARAVINTSNRHGIFAERVALPQTREPNPEGYCLGDADPNQQREVSVYVRSKASQQELDREVKRIRQGVATFPSDQEFQEKFGADPASINEIRQFAKANGLVIADIDSASGRIVLSATNLQFNIAFGTKLEKWQKDDGTTFCARRGPLTVPKDLAPHIEGIFGLDERPQARSHYRRLSKAEIELARLQQGQEAHQSGFIAHAFNPSPHPMMPNEVAQVYHFPDKTTGKGQAIAIIELAGNPNPDDYARYYREHHLPVPEFHFTVIDGSSAKVGKIEDANGEPALDAEIAGAVAPDAVQDMIFAPNSERGFIDAVERAVFPNQGERDHQAVSISWGRNESGWTEQGMRMMDSILKKAYLKGIGVYAATGDDGATDRSSIFEPDYPASDPHVTATGGTRLITRHGRIASETVWNNNEAGSTGGGISNKWPVPEYQQYISLPPSANGDGTVGRGVPDIVGNADSKSGYEVRIDGEDTVIGGTSAVAPLMAALHARLAEGVGAGKPTMIGNLNPFFYRHGNRDGFFNDITEGNNGGYAAVPGWDAASGWGSIKDGNHILAALKADIQARHAGPSTLFAPFVKPKPRPSVFEFWKN